MQLVQGYGTLQTLVLLAVVLPGSVSSQECRPPSITTQGERVVFFTDDEHMSIPCVATGSGPLQHTWTFNGSPLTLSGPSYTGREMHLESSTGALVIGFPDVSHQGYYQCRVSNDCGTSLSVKTLTFLARIEPFPLQSSPQVVHAGVGGIAVFRCWPPFSIPHPQVQWRIMDDFRAVVLDDRVTMDFWGFLYITNVRPEDAQGGKVYVCSAANSIARVNVLGHDTRLEVSGSGSGPQYPVQLLWSSPSDAFALEGQTAKMKCIFSGNPPPMTTWNRQSGQFDDSRTHQGHHELQINNVQASDAGVYTCSGQNEYGSAVTSTFNLHVESVPRWQSEPVDITAIVGESAEFDCSAEGNPNPVVHWFINGQPYQSLPADSRRTLAGNRLHFSHLQLSDSLVVQCNASNYHGYAWADVSLYVAVN